MYFCRSWFSNMVSFRYVLVFLKFLHDIFSIRFYTISFLRKRNFFIDEKHTQWILDTKEKVVYESVSCFMKWSSNCISWNTVYPSLKGFSLKPIKGFCLEGENPTLNELKYKVCVLKYVCVEFSIFDLVSFSLKLTFLFKRLDSLTLNSFLLKLTFLLKRLDSLTLFKIKII